LIIKGIGIVCASGTGIKEFEQSIRNKTVPSDYSQTDLKPLNSFINPSKIRRLDCFSKSALLSAYLALNDSGLEPDSPERIGIVTGTGNGPLKTTFEFLDNIIEYGDESSSPLLFANSVHNAPASHISMNLGITGPCSTVTCFNNTVSNVLLTAQHWLDTGLVDFVLACCGDEMHDTVNYSVLKINKEPSDYIMPFVLNKSSYRPGEGFVSFILGNDKPGYCSVNSIQTRQKCNTDIFNNSDYFIISGNGNCMTNPVLKKMVFNKPVTAYSSYCGSIMTGCFFDIAAGALALRLEKIFPAPNTETDFPDNFNILKEEAILNKKSVIGCIEPGERDEYNYYELSL
jgi:3-oxoacyl-[acyl-carrier-protein] synthase II